MLIHPQINPVALQIGTLAVHWYGLTYLVAFGLFLFLAKRRLGHQPYAAMTGAAAWTSNCSCLPAHRCSSTTDVTSFSTCTMTERMLRAGTMPACACVWRRLPDP